LKLENAYYSPSYTFTGLSPQSHNSNHNQYFQHEVLNCYIPKEEIKYVCNYEVQIENEDKFRITKRIIGNSVKIQ
jgi:hypothetical protein